MTETLGRGSANTTAAVSNRPPAAPAVNDRRSFLRRMGLGAATVFVAADGLVAYRAWDQGVLTEGKGPAFEALKKWQAYEGLEAVVAAAVLAASAHNTQPWAFAIVGDRVDLYADMARTTGANDALLREFHVSLGCALENLVLAAGAEGYRAEVQLADGSDDQVATVVLQAGESFESELYRAIPLRRSNRSEFTDTPLDETVLPEMGALVDDGVDLVWLSDPDDRNRFADLLVDATQAHIDDDDKSIASHAWWRSDWDQVQRHKDGLNIDGVGLPPLVRTLARLLPATGRSANDKSFLEVTEKQAESAAAFGVLTVDDPFSVQGQLRGGRVLERLHLWAAANDVGFQHMNQVTEIIDRDRQLGNDPRFEQPLEALAGAGALAAFRIGSPSVASRKSPRRPVEEVLR